MPPAFGQMRVDLHKKPGVNLGLTVSGGIDRGEVPLIANIRPGSIADRSDSLLLNDHILAINGVMTDNLRHDEIVRLAKHSGPKIHLDIEYDLPDHPPMNCRTKRCALELRRDSSDNFGLVVRGGWTRNSSQTRKLTVMYVRPGSVGERHGCLKAGDRILAINDLYADRMTGEEANKLIRKSKSKLKLLIEYNVANVDEGRNVMGSVVVEIEKLPFEKLGVELIDSKAFQSTLIRVGQHHMMDSNDKHDFSTNTFYINYIRPASIADRCGALMIGDRVEAIDDFPTVEMSLNEAMHRIKSNVSDSIRLQITPVVAPTPLRYETSKTQSDNKKKLKSQQNNFTVPLASNHIVNTVLNKYQNAFQENHKPCPPEPSPNSSDQDSKMIQNHKPTGPLKTHDMRTQSLSSISSSSSGPCSCILESKDSNRNCRSSFSSSCASLGLQSELSDSESREIFSSCSEDERPHSNLSKWSAPSKLRSGPKEKTSTLSCPPSPTSLPEPAVATTSSKSLTAKRCLKTGPASSLSAKTRSRQSSRGDSPCSGPAGVSEPHQFPQNFASHFNRSTTSLHSRKAFMTSTNSIVCRMDQINVHLTPTVETVTLAISHGFPSYGFTLRPASFSLGDKDPFNSPLEEYPVIDQILFNSCAFQTGVLQEGDRLLSINHESTLEKSLRYLHEEYLTGRVDGGITTDDKGIPSPLVLTTEYTISDSVIPDSGIFNVKLCKHFNSLGINLQASITGQPKRPLLISKVIPGSVASRSGSIKPGDLLIAVNGVPLENCTLPEAVNLLQSEDPVVVLRLQKGPFTFLSANSAPKSISSKSSSGTHSTGKNKNSKDWSKFEASIPIDADCYIRRIELSRDSASRAWGIVISGTDDTPNAPILIDSLTPGDPGQQSGLLSVGDRIMAINGVPIYQGFTLSQAMQELQQYPDRVMLHIMRSRIMPNDVSRRKQISLRKISAHPSFNKSIDTTNDSSIESSLSGSFPHEIEDRFSTSKRANSSGRPASRGGKSLQQSFETPGTHLPNNHIHHGRVKSDHISPINWEKIHCVGCREAIAYEMGQQDVFRQLTKRSGKKEEDIQRKLLANDSVSFESNIAANDAMGDIRRPISRSNKKMSNKKSSDMKISNLRHSRSDSKLNKDSVRNGNAVMSGQQTPNSQITVIPGPTFGKTPSGPSHAIGSAFKSAITKVKSRTLPTNFTRGASMEKPESSSEMRVLSQNQPNKTFDVLSRAHHKYIETELMNNPPAGIMMHQMSKTRSTSQDRTSQTSQKLWIRLYKSASGESYGIGVSEGVISKGIFVSAIRSNSPAHRSALIKLYDRILQINDVPIGSHMTCSQVVNLISKSDKFIDILLQRKRQGVSQISVEQSLGFSNDQALDRKRTIVPSAGSKSSKYMIAANANLSSKKTSRNQ